MIHVFRIEKPTGIFTPPGSSFASCVGSIEKIASFIHAAINEIPEKHRSCSERNFAKPPGVGSRLEKAQAQKQIV